VLPICVTKANIAAVFTYAMYLLLRMFLLFDGVDRFMYYVSSSHHHTSHAFALKFFSLPTLIHRRQNVTVLVTEIGWLRQPEYQAYVDS